MNCNRGDLSNKCDGVRIVSESSVIPGSVGMAFTTRKGGKSQKPFDGFNLGLHVGDNPVCVNDNRELLGDALPGVNQIIWLNQIHSCNVVKVDDSFSGVPDADASVTRKKGIALAIMTADCLPVLLAADDGSVVGAAHCGWRGLAGGVLKNSVESMDISPDRISAWLGPCIGPSAFEVGEIVREFFFRLNPQSERCFKVQPPKNGENKYLADLPALAEMELKRLGVTKVISSGLCTYSDGERFFSYRREQITGRMASLVWIR